eukprot:Gregarina_sp_Poly_1__934@NODE_1225_length_4722_cov_98_593770_g209_i1_p1_GENE_NODE_1225_length_4722_cov_98_593770_g209_i1NODE_1225_length_4722_cov_98_593770_g209_i1_p1_ORF_typecomplete_len732_score76_55DnaJ/PF00226_31/2_7e20Thioredoxin_6/PF13848_6/0_057Thioredoxin_6/PF13848_6/5_4e03YdjM/PF04307_14/0_18_NODE_1225_length_4722_cov_98_593770_g209_i114603655
MPPKKGKGAKGTSPAAKHSTPENVSDTPRPELPTPVRSRRQTSKTQVTPKSGVKVLKKRKASAQYADDDSEIAEILTTAPGSNTTARPRRKAKQGGFLGRLWSDCGSAILVVVTIILLIVLLKMGEDEYLDVTSSSTRINSDPYQVLGLTAEATKKDIRKAYRTLTLKWHPDKQEHACGDECRIKFNQINQAYKLLIDDERRSLYDSYQADATTETKKAFMNKIEYWEFTGSADSIKSLLKPSLNGGQLSLPPHVTGAWVYLVADTRQEITDYILETWTEISSKLYGKIAFMRIEGSDEETRKMLPLNPVMLPAIVYCDPINGCQIYNQLLNYGPITFPKWLLAQFPETVREWPHSIDELAQIMRRGKTKSGKTPLIVTGALKPPNIVRALALKTAEAFEWYYTSSVEIVQALNITFFELDKGTRGLVIGPNADKSIIQLHGGLWQLDKEKWYRERSDSEDVKTARHGHAYLTLIEALHNLTKSNEMSLTEETLLYLCHSNDISQRVICRVRVNPSAALDTYDIEAISAISIDLEPIGVTVDTLDEEVLAQADEDEIDLDGDSEPDESSGGLVNEVLTTTPFIQAVRLDTTSIGGLRSALVQMVSKRDKREFFLDMSAGKYRFADDTAWSELPAACARKGGPIAGTTCAPRSNISGKDRIKLFFMRPWGLLNALFHRSIFHTIWAIPAFATYMACGVWFIYSIGRAAHGMVFHHAGEGYVKEVLSDTANTD